MGPIIKILLVAIAVSVAYRLIRGGLNNVLGSRGPGKSKFKCATCKNCKTLFDDGVLCVYGSRETFKNETHIANCQDHEFAR